MRFSYYPETDSLYIELNPEVRANAPAYKEGEHGHQVVVSNEMVVDLDASGKPVKIDIHSFASELFDLKKLEAEGPIFGLMPIGNADK